MTKSFKINPEIVHDTIDGEVILLDIEKGYYYQLKNEAVLVWEAIASQKTSSIFTVANILAKNGKYSQDEILRSVSSFIDQLISEQIVLEIEKSKKEDDKLTFSKEKRKVSESQFPTPVLLKYTDMQSILLLDPIHDTDEKGWPNKKTKTFSKT